MLKDGCPLPANNNNTIPGELGGGGAIPICLMSKGKGQALTSLEVWAALKIMTPPTTLSPKTPSKGVLKKLQYSENCSP